MKLIKICFIYLFVFISLPSRANINEHFNSIKSDPNALHAFFKTMPKGGELHYHFTGGAYPEAMLTQAAFGRYCIAPVTFVLRADEGVCAGVTAKNLTENEPLYNQTIRAWSMKDFIPGQESGHDHFFSTFSKFGSVTKDFRVILLADIIGRAADQNELYMEIQLFSLGHDSEYANLIHSAKNYPEKKRILLSTSQFQNRINILINDGRQLLRSARDELGCSKTPKNPACSLAVKFQYFVKRDEPLDSVFAQALAGFVVASQSDEIVGINLVEAEDGILSLQDYDEQMLIFKYLHSIYPNVHIALHAGELAPEDVQAQNIRFHIRHAIFLGQAERIGHGVDIAYEDNSYDLLKYMAGKPIPVEINLTSNRAILNIYGKRHPLRFYLNNHVPVVLSTDDEGILRTDLTSQYVDAVIEHGIDYSTIKMINRNALTYSFLPGKSLWLLPGKSLIESACKDVGSIACQEFVVGNKKATLQRELEVKLLEFEKAW